MAAVSAPTRDTKKVPTLSAVKLLKGIDAAQGTAATRKIFIKSCDMIFALLLPRESNIPIPFLRPLVHIVTSMVSITVLTAEIMMMVVLTSFCGDFKGLGIAFSNRL